MFSLNQRHLQYVKIKRQRNHSGVVRNEQLVRKQGPVWTLHCVITTVIYSESNNINSINWQSCLQHFVRASALKYESLLSRKMFWHSRKSVNKLNDGWIPFSCLRVLICADDSLSQFTERLDQDKANIIATFSYDKSTTGKWMVIIHDHMQERPMWGM